MVFNNYFSVLTQLFIKKILKFIVIMACKWEQNKEEGRNEVLSSYFWGKKYNE